MLHSNLVYLEMCSIAILLFLLKKCCLPALPPVRVIRWEEIRGRLRVDRPFGHRAQLGVQRWNPRHGRRRWETCRQEN